MNGRHFIAMEHVAGRSLRRLGRLVRERHRRRLGRPLVLRVVASQSRTTTPFGWWCTGSIKALIGCRSLAVTPRGLARHLQDHGAEAVLMPCVADAATSSPPSAHGGFVQT